MLATDTTPGEPGRLPAQKALWRLLKGAPHQPLAVFSHGDAIGRSLLVWCTEAGIAVPSDVAVLSVNNEPFFCDTVWPGLSSIELPWEEGGRLLAEHLRRHLISGHAASGRIVLPPSRIVERASTRILAVDDPLKKIPAPPPGKAGWPGATPDREPVSKANVT